MNKVESYFINKAKEHFNYYVEETDWMCENILNTSWTFQDFVEDAVDYAVSEATHEVYCGWVFDPRHRLKVNQVAEYMDVEALRYTLMDMLDCINENERFLYEIGGIEELELYDIEGLV